ncbi:hypothetical protein D2T31_13900 [Sinirhodobacter populi]|uniref:Uncharacterized protein n=1 Tax=Paenirhodobacter populi TaxID=2306993 RepID=A0A443K6S7_9RHOB|nr:hypothetical protein [Sinirhodobacter populi]RWR28446.1 hypothetical protein D2T31_13900 [Sinirhodobacter populi]
MPPDDAALIADWTALCAALENGDSLSCGPLACGLLAAVALGLSGDSRGFARDFGIAHALVLREVNILSGDLGLLTVTRNDERTQRSFLALSLAGKDLTDRLTRA